MIVRTEERRGFTLIEMVATMGVASVLAGVAVAMLYLLLGVERGSREGLHRWNSVSRLAQQFREDARAAVGNAQSPAERPSGGAKSPLEWEFPLGKDRRIHYTATPEELVRTEHDGGKPVGRESFAIGPGAEVSLALSGGDVTGGRAPALVSLTIAHKPAPPGEPTPRDVRIEAVLGGDQRFLATKEGSP